MLGSSYLCGQRSLAQLNHVQLLDLIALKLACFSNLRKSVSCIIFPSNRDPFIIDPALFH